MTATAPVISNIADIMLIEGEDGRWYYQIRPMTAEDIYAQRGAREAAEVAQRKAARTYLIAASDAVMAHDSFGGRFAPAYPAEACRAQRKAARTYCQPYIDWDRVYRCA